MSKFSAVPVFSALALLAFSNSVGANVCKDLFNESAATKDEFQAYELRVRSIEWEAAAGIFREIGLEVAENNVIYEVRGEDQFRELLSQVESTLDALDREFHSATSLQNRAVGIPVGVIGIMALANLANFSPLGAGMAFTALHGFFALNRTLASGAR